jgi:hypothetical protein
MARKEASITERLLLIRPRENTMRAKIIGILDAVSDPVSGSVVIKSPRRGRK